MANKTLGRYVNVVSWEADLASLKRVRDQAKNLRKEMQGIFRGVSGSLPSSIPIPRQPKSQMYDSHVKSREKMLDQERQFKTYQEDFIRNFFVRNKLTREMSDEERKLLTTQFMQTKNAKELRYESRKILGTLMDEQGKRRRINAELEKQNLLQRRANSSMEQMVGTLASVYTATALIGSSIRTGMDFEAMSKGFIVVSKDAEDARQNLAWINEEANRLGLPITEAANAYKGFLAAMSNKLAVQEVRDIFTGVSEASVALGLSTEAQGRIFLAVKQMASKGKIQAKLLGLFKLRELLGSLSEVISSLANAGMR